MDEYTPELAAQEFSEMADESSNTMRMWVIQQWMKARERAPQSDQRFYLMIDEIQKAPNWSQLVKGLWDEDRRYHHRVQVVLLGSSPHLLQKGLTESLAGRFIKFRSPHWSYLEMSEAFGYSLDEYLYFGGYPGAVHYRKDEVQWREYISESIIEATIDKDIITLIPIDDPGAVKRLFEIGAEKSGQPMALKKISDSLQECTQVQLQHYLDILERVFLLTGLRHFSQMSYKQFGVPKFQALNTSLMSMAFDYSFVEATNHPKHWGRVIESAVGAHILNSSRGVVKLCYWRHNGYEVDFVVTSSSHILLLEVKSGKKKAQRKSAGKFIEFQKGEERSITFHIIGAGGEGGKSPPEHGREFRPY